jgi:hypothetical protein
VPPRMDVTSTSRHAGAVSSAESSITLTLGRYRAQAFVGRDERDSAGAADAQPLRLRGYSPDRSPSRPAPFGGIDARAAGAHPDPGIPSATTDSS